MIAERLLSNGRDDLARQLGDRDECFAAQLTPLLAAAGDLDAQLPMLESVVADLREGKLPDEPRMAWLAGARSPKLLDPLFEVVRLGYKTSDRPTRGVTVGYDLDDVTRPTIEAIAEIGGRAAVAGYDALISEGGDFRWLSRQRDQIAGGLLATDGERFAAVAAKNLSVPLLGEPDVED
jgi:hypothetical protein